MQPHPIGKRNITNLFLSTDHIRPDWNRMVDVTRAPPGSRRNSATQANSSRSRGVSGAIGSIMTRPGRSASSAASNEYYVSSAMRRMNLQNMDLEDLMVMEAVRLSLLEEEERRQTEQQQQQRQQQEQLPATEGANNLQQQQEDHQRSGTERGLILEEANEEEEEEEDDDNEPLFNSVINGIRERQNTTELSTETTSSSDNEGKNGESSFSNQSDHATADGSHTVPEHEVLDLPAFESSSLERQGNKDHKSLITVEGDERSHLESVSSI